MANHRIIETDDGSHTIYVPTLDETYHSVHGAIQESNHIFISTGLKNFLDESKLQKVAILEFGFGSGLNALLTAIGTGAKVRYVSLEKYPLPESESRVLNYGREVNADTLFDSLHRAAWGQDVIITADFTLHKVKIDFRDFKSIEKFDIIYFDAFAPDKQPELWQRPIFENCYRMLNQGGRLVTYSARGQVRRDLRAAGFTVEKLPGPPGKREITRAVKA